MIAFNDPDCSNPITLNVFDMIQNIGCQVSNDLPSGKLTAESLTGKRLFANLTSLKGTNISVCYNMDGSSERSNPVIYPLGGHQIFVFDDGSCPYLTPGEHKISFRLPDTGGHVSEDSVSYTINSRPLIALTSLKLLSLKTRSIDSVSVPISVTDEDGDDIEIFYRFDDEEE
jgi:hypothetical protein